MKIDNYISNLKKEIDKPSKKNEARISQLAEEINHFSKENQLNLKELNKVLELLQGGFQSKLFQTISEETSTSLLKLASRCEFLKEQIEDFRKTEEEWILLEKPSLFPSPISILDSQLFANTPTGIPNQVNTCFAASFLQMVENDPIMQTAIEKFTPNDNSLKRVHEEYRRKLHNPEGPIQIKQLREFLNAPESTDQEDITELMLMCGLYFDIPGNGKVQLEDGLEYQFGTEFFKYDGESGNLLSETNGGKNRFPFGFCYLEEAQEGTDLEHLLSRTFLETPLQMGDTFYFGIQRFRNDRSKIETRINIPLRLEIPAEIQPLTAANSNKSIYQLQSFCVHEGHSLTSGHYIAYIKKEDKYFCANDSQITEIDIETFLDKASQAYVLNYSRLNFEQ